MVSHVKEFFYDSQVASIASTREHVVEEILKSLSPETSKVVIEIGPGDGAFTKVILSRLRSRAKCIAIETNPHFIEILRTKYNDPRIEIVHDSAYKITSLLASRKIYAVDYIISGIPLTPLSLEQKENFFENCYQCLEPGGHFVIYQFLLPGNRSALEKLLRKKFEICESRMHALNLPPLFAITARKKSYHTT